MPSYRGNCLCCASIFDVTLDDDLKAVRLCNCSYCEQRVPHWVYVAADKLKFERAGPAEDYKGHKFCTLCGTLMIAMDEQAGIMVANVRTFQEIEPWSLEEQENYNSNTRTRKADLTHADLFNEPLNESQAFYQGACPCGAARIAMDISPLSQDTCINECNCSKCWRLAMVTLYPYLMKPRAVVKAQGLQNLSIYKRKEESGENFGVKFCKHCGMWMVVCGNLGDDEAAMQEAEKSEHPEKEWISLSAVAVNLHTLYDVDRGQLEITKYDGRKEKSVREYKVE